MSEQSAGPLVSITRAEARVLDELMRDGASNQTIARRLCLSEDTVKTHMKRLLAATDCPDRTSLVVAIFRRAIRIRVRRTPAHPSARTTLPLRDAA